MQEISKEYEAALHGAPLDWLLARGLDESTIRRFRLGYVAEGRYRNSISIPYLNPYHGSIRTMRFRYLNPLNHKYDSMSGHGVHLYNVSATMADHVFICEGEFDALILTQLGHSAVGVAGAHSFKEEWRYLFHSCEKVSLVFDADEAGERGSRRLASILGEVLDDVQIIHLPEGQDVTDMYINDRSELLRLVS